MKHDEANMKEKQIRKKTKKAFIEVKMEKKAGRKDRKEDQIEN